MRPTPLLGVLALPHFLNQSRIGANIFGDSCVYSGMQGKAMAHVSGLAEAA